MTEYKRPAKNVTPEVLSKLEEAFLLGCSDKEACFYADISPATLYNFQEINPDFVDRKEELKQNPILIARKTVVEGLRQDRDLSLKYLERKRKTEFSPRQEITGKDGKDLNPTLDPEDIAKFDAIVKAAHDRRNNQATGEGQSQDSPEEVL